jgi:pimeloyl-ACP methyl ester carboxylesterase
MTLRKPVWLIVILALLLSACNTAPTPAPAVTSTPNPTGVPRFEKTDCWFKKPIGRDVECGWLIVPEDHAKPEGKIIKLAVARFTSDADKPEPDPIVYLEGGPGSGPLKSYSPQFDAYFGPLAEKRDVILFDQRGTGYSEPSLNCPELKELVLATLDQDLSQEESRKLSVEASLKCRERLVKEGVNLAAYNTAQNAADIEALRQAMGYDQINLYGTSYGTRLALTALRDQAAGIRSAVIDSVVPLQADLFAQILPNGMQALEKVLTACEADAECKANYPNLRQVLLDTKAKLDKEPAELDITLKTGEKKEALLNGDGLIGALFLGLYSTPLIPTFPRMIYDARDGKYDLIGGLIAAQVSQADDISQGMYYSVHCQEEVPFVDAPQIDADVKQHPEFEVLADKSTLQLCSSWGVPAAAAVENQAVSSDVPTLVISGEFDPITPPTYGQTAAQTLSKSFAFTAPRAGHGSSVTEDCPRSLVLAFLDNPAQKPNDACLSEMAKAAFEPPLTVASFKLKPVTLAINTGLSTLNLDALLPENWKEVAPGAYSPNGKMTDQTMIVMQAAPIDPDTLLNLFTSQLKSTGFDVKFEQIDTRTANGIDWTIYSGEALISAVDLALGQKGDMTYLILMQVPLSDRAVLREAVLQPAIDALKPAK